MKKEKTKTMNIKGLFIAGFISLAAIGVTTLAASDTAFADAAGEMQAGLREVGGSDNKMTLQEGLTNITNVLLYLLGAIAVIMIIIGGIRYVTSNGDASATKGAKDTILYAVIGLIVAILAYAIVNFVITSFSGNSSSSGGTGTTGGR